MELGILKIGYKIKNYQKDGHYRLIIFNNALKPSLIKH